MKKEEVATQAKVYLYHLNNANDENGIRKHEGWKFSMVDAAGKLDIERTYYPTLSVAVKTTVIEDFSAHVMLGISSNYPKILVPDKSIDLQKGASYFIAYSPERKIR